MPSKRTIRSTYALLDVTTGRAALHRELGQSLTAKRIPVVITGFIRYAYGSDDGTSRQFIVDVTKVETGDAE